MKRLLLIVVVGWLICRFDVAQPIGSFCQTEFYSAVLGDEKSNNAAAAMVLEITINRPDNSGRGYRKPYVAAWLADNDGFPVKTLLLWVQASGKGPRWIPDLRMWHRDDRLRQLVDDRDLVDAISSPTRTAGTYKVQWDGKDDLGTALPPGDYTLFIEAAREHGTYQLIREKLTLNADSFRKELKGNTEIKGVKIVFQGLPGGK